MDDTLGSGSDAAKEVPVPAKSPNFFSHMLSLDSAAKAQLLNLVQYSAICVIPVVVLLKLVQHFLPEHDASKSNADLAMESIGQIAVIVVGIWFIDRFVRYFRTYSGTPYSPFSPTTFVAPLILIMVTMQSKLGQKMTALTNRVTAMAGIHIGREGMDGGGASKAKGAPKPLPKPAPRPAPAPHPQPPPPQQTRTTAAEDPKERKEQESFETRSGEPQEDALEAYSFSGGGQLGGSAY